MASSTLPTGICALCQTWTYGSTAADIFHGASGQFKTTWLFEHLKAVFIAFGAISLPVIGRRRVGSSYCSGRVPGFDQASPPCSQPTPASTR